ncbi:hypothetical protein OG588_26250 [Streptomyces prunicolor]|uniref:hypothetical protein n=1 Tax=Streptomyces prunicolor TaxID=67348 RepID=UPI003862F9D3|nr:hypothetical protein OG588_26250 [Streptomyces prunicolor]
MSDSAEIPKFEDEAGDDFETLDSLIPEDWSDDCVVSLDAWKQGDLLPGCTLPWAAPSGLDPVTGVDSGTDSDGESAPVNWVHISVEDFRCAWAIVTSQTCDVAAVGPGARHPLVQVSPVVRIPNISDNRRAAIEGHEVTHLVALTRPPGEGFWVADLRINFPVSKQLLVVNDPVAAFASERDALDFAEHVASRLRRPSLHDMVSDVMVRSISQYIKNVQKGEPDWWEWVEQLRVLITGERLNPESVQLVVVQQEKLEASQRKIWRDWATSFRKELRAAGIILTPVHFTTLDAMSARLYRNSIPLRVLELRRPHTW